LRCHQKLDGASIAQEKENVGRRQQSETHIRLGLKDQQKRNPSYARTDENVGDAVPNRAL